MNTLSSSENSDNFGKFEELYQKVGELSLLELEELTTYIFNLRKKKLPTVLSKEEEIIIQKINTPLPKDIQERYNFLRKEKSSNSLQETEHKELLTLTSYMEAHEVKRLGLFIELSELRNMPLDSILKEFEVKSAEYDS